MFASSQIEPRKLAQRCNRSHIETPGDFEGQLSHFYKRVRHPLSTNCEVLREGNFHWKRRCRSPQRYRETGVSPQSRLIGLLKWSNLFATVQSCCVIQLSQAPSVIRVLPTRFVFINLYFDLEQTNLNTR